MIFLNDEKIAYIKKDSKRAYKVINELFASIFIADYYNGDNFFLNEKPDLINLSKKIAFEIAQCDLDIDLNIKYIYESLGDNDFDYSKTLEELKSAFDIDPSLYSFSCDDSNKIISFSPISNGESPYYFLPIYKKVIRNKLEKLNNGNYNAFDNVSLVLSSIARYKTNDDINKICELYNEISKSYTRKFNSLFIITTSSLYINEQSNIKKNRFDCNYFNEVVNRCKEIISFVEKDNSLFVNNPEIAIEWDFLLNDCTPDKVTPYSHYKAHWKCKNGHSYVSLVSQRTRGSGCPYCSGRYPIKGENDLAAVNPNLVKE